MTKAQWMALEHFKAEEFDSPDKPGSSEGMQYTFMRALDAMRWYAGIPFAINSGFRTKAHNKKVGGRSNSAHLRGWAADIACGSSADAFKIIDAAFREGINRIVIYPTWIHVDMDPTLPKNIIEYGKVK